MIDETDTHVDNERREPVNFKTLVRICYFGYCMLAMFCFSAVSCTSWRPLAVCGTAGQAVAREPAAGPQHGPRDVSAPASTERSGNHKIDTHGCYMPEGQVNDLQVRRGRVLAVVTCWLKVGCLPSAAETTGDHVAGQLEVGLARGLRPRRSACREGPAEAATRVHRQGDTLQRQVCDLQPSPATTLFCLACRLCAVAAGFMTTSVWQHGMQHA